MRGDADALESCEDNAAFLFTRSVRSRLSLSSFTLSCSTATLSATRPASSAPTTTIHVTPLRSGLTGRSAGTARGLRRGGARTGASACAVASHEAIRP